MVLRVFISPGIALWVLWLSLEFFAVSLLSLYSSVSAFPLFFCPSILLSMSLIACFSISFSPCVSLFLFLSPCLF